MNQDFPRPVKIGRVCAGRGLYRCACGVEFEAPTERVGNGRRSCGCLQKHRGLDLPPGAAAELRARVRQHGVVAVARVLGQKHAWLARVVRLGRCPAGQLPALLAYLDTASKAPTCARCDAPVSKAGDSCEPCRVATEEAQRHALNASRRLRYRREVAARRREEATPPPPPTAPDDAPAPVPAPVLRVLDWMRWDGGWLAEPAIARSAARHGATLDEVRAALDAEVARGSCWLHVSDTGPRWKWRRSCS